MICEGWTEFRAVDTQPVLFPLPASQCQGKKHRWGEPPLQVTLVAAKCTGDEADPHMPKAALGLLIIASHDCPVRARQYGNCNLVNLPKIMDKKGCTGNILKFSLALMERTIHEKLLS